MTYWTEQAHILGSKAQRLIKSGKLSLTHANEYDINFLLNYRGNDLDEITDTWNRLGNQL